MAVREQLAKTGKKLSPISDASVANQSAKLLILK
jgi:hypothetical protein